MTFSSIATVRNLLDLLSPFIGPCAICGGPDKRHRLADAVVSNVHGGDPTYKVAEWYEIPESTVIALVEHADRQRKRKKARWPRLAEGTDR